MNFTRFRLFAPVGTAIALLAQPVFANNNRSWVSHNGKDGYPCTATLPCATFQHAHDVTIEGGEVDALDPGDYGPFYITKAITIDGGNMGYISTLGADGIDVAAEIGATVILRNLSVNNNFNSAIGILQTGGSYLYVENASITGAAYGIVSQSSPQNGVNQLVVINTTIRNSSVAGIFVSTVGGTSSGTNSSILAAAFGPIVQLKNVTVEDSPISLKVDGVYVNVASCLFGGASTAAVYANSAEVNLADSTVVGSAIGIAAYQYSAIRISGNNIHDNAKAFYTSGSSSGLSQILSFGTNRIMGNKASEDPSSTVPLK